METQRTSTIRYKVKRDNGMTTGHETREEAAFALGRVAAHRQDDTGKRTTISQISPSGLYSAHYDGRQGSEILESFAVMYRVR